VTDSLARNTIASAIAAVATLLGGFASTVVAARLLGVEGAGIFAFAVWAITVSVMVADLGIPGTLARYIPDLRSRSETEQAMGLVRWLFWIALAAAIGVSSVFAAIAVWLWSSGAATSPDISGGFRRDAVFWALIGVACLVQVLAAFGSGWLKGTQQFATLARFAVASAVLQIAVTSAGAVLFGPNGALAGAIAGSVLPLILIPRMLEAERAPDPHLKARVRRFALESWAAYVVTAFAWARMEIFFLERSWGSSSVALFAASLTIANLATQGPLLLTGGLLPYFAQNARAENRHKAARAYAVSMRVLAFLIFPACLGAAAIAPALLPAIYGEGFAAAGPSAIILLLGASVSATSAVAFTFLLAMERTRFVFVLGSIAALASIAVGLVVIPAYGVMAAALGRAAIQTSVAAMTVWYVGYSLQCPPPFASLVRLFAAAVICAVAAWGATRLMSGAAGIPVAVLCGVLTYGLAVRVLRALPADDLRQLMDAASVLPRPLRAVATMVLQTIASK
jgi:O-antigen/teichoic acid export membrane protein